MVTKLKEFLHKQPALCLVNCLELIKVGKKTDLEEFPLKSEKRFCNGLFCKQRSRISY